MEYHEIKNIPEIFPRATAQRLGQPIAGDLTIFRGCRRRGPIAAHGDEPGEGEAAGVVSSAETSGSLVSALVDPGQWASASEIPSDRHIAWEDAPR
jgi:hypothetical protein